MISYPELPTFQTVGFTKWLVERFSVYRGLSKKEHDVKWPPGNGLGKSNGVRREEVLAFISGENHKMGFLGEQDVIRLGAMQEVPGEVLKQLKEEEPRSMLGCKQSEQRLQWSLLAREDHPVRTLVRGLILMVGWVP